MRPKKKMTKKFLESRCSKKGKFPRGSKSLRKMDGDENVSPPTGMSRINLVSSKFINKGYIGTNFNLIRRFLKSRIGKNWNDVYSEICEDADVRSFEGNHLREWLSCVVEINTRIEDGEIVSEFGYKITSPEDFYVDPNTNILKQVEKSDYKREKATNLEQGVYEVDGQTYCKHEGLWYRVEMKEVENCSKTIADDEKIIKFVHLNSGSITSSLRRKYGHSPNGKSWYCSRKESANSKEISKIKDEIEN